MSDPDNFIARWSRRKREATQPERTATSAVPETDADQATEGANAAAPARETGGVTGDNVPAFDPTSLPPIESITAETDIHAFLAPGVPAELRHAALRRAWSADPAIRDFVGLVENAWDFNDPASIGGFGAIESTADLARDVARIVGDLAADSDAPAVETQPSELAGQSEAGAEGSAPADAKEVRSRPGQDEIQPPPAKDLAAGADDYSASQQESKATESLQLFARRRGHGGALPE